MTSRTFTLTRPHMTGDDVKAFQRELTERFAGWEIAHAVADDGDYGMQTRHAARQVCRALGLGNATAHGVTPELRTKIRHPELRTPAEIERSESGAIRGYRTKLRRRFAIRVKIAPGANLADKPISQVTLDFVGRVSRRAGREIVITTGTNHSKFTVDGNISDHFSGHAVDIGMAANGGTDDGPVGDAIMAAALREAGFSPAEANAHAASGGLFNHDTRGLRVQCIWKTDVGGNHHNHVHIGVRPLA
jgi:hypothetical protein